MLTLSALLVLAAFLLTLAAAANRAPLWIAVLLLVLVHLLLIVPPR